MYLLKKIINEINIPLAHTFNLSLTSVLFLKNLNQLELYLCIFKSGKSGLCDNYRPISLLSRILEKFVSIQLVNHLDLNKYHTSILKNTIHLASKIPYIQPQKYHTSFLKNKLSKALYALRTVKNLLSQKSLLLLYNSIFHCHLLQYMLYKFGLVSDLVLLINFLRCKKQQSELYQELLITPILNHYLKSSKFFHCLIS